MDYSGVLPLLRVADMLGADSTYLLEAIATSRLTWNEEVSLYMQGLTPKWPSRVPLMGCERHVRHDFTSLDLSPRE